MKSLIISISILLIVFFSFTATLAVQEEKGPEAPAKAQQTPQVEDTALRDTADANSIADANAAADVNAVTDANAMRGFKGLRRAVERVYKLSRDEIREWMRVKIENRLNLIKAVQRQYDQEFVFLRKLAVEEGAVKTVEAIDRLSAARHERYDDIIKRAEGEKKRILREEREEERRDRGRTRGTRDRDKRRRGRSSRRREQDED